MKPSEYAVTFACYNQVAYTEQCIYSMVRHGLPMNRLVVVDNASSDNTRRYLETIPGLIRIYNRQNLGCGVAWNQGALELQAEWTVVMNNDVLVSKGWLDGLVDAAKAGGYKVVSPALIEGQLDYDFDEFAEREAVKMKDVVRPGGRHAVCMAIHQSVWDAVGYFQPVPSLWGFEDTLFFLELERAGIPTAIVGSSWLHHHGSVTLSLLKQERGLSQKEGLSPRDTYKKLGMSFLERKWRKFTRRQLEREWKNDELARFGMTLHGERKDGKFTWR